MGKDLYNSVISKIAVIAPMFAKALVDMGLEKYGLTPYTVTPSQMKRIIDEEVFPKLKNFIKEAGALETIGGGKIVFNNKGEVVSIDNAVKKLIGLQPEMVFNITSNDKLQIKAPLNSVLNENKEVVIYEVSIKEPNVILNIAGGPVKDGDNKITGAMFFLQDMTLRKSLETEIDNVYEKLERTNNELKTAQNVAMQSEKMAAIGQLAGGVAHEINNPIAVILGFSQVLTKRLLESDANCMPLRSIEREALRCKKLVNDLLTFSRTSKSSMEPIDLNVAIDGALSLVETKAKMRNIGLIRNFDDKLPNITANSNQIQQVIINLCNNAIDAILESASDGQITITTKCHDGFIEISVSDTGSGIPEEVRKHLFEPFFTTKEVGKGTGLGLSLVYEIVQKHKGTIEVESKLPVGPDLSFKGSSGSLPGDPDLCFNRLAIRFLLLLMD